MATVKLGDIAIEAKSSNKGDKTGIRIVGLEHLTPSNVTLSSWSEDTENTFTKEFSKGDVLFGRRRAYLKKAAVAPFGGICSGDITVIRAIEDKVDPDLLPFIIQNDFLFDFAVGKSAGSLSPRVKWTHLKEFAIELPSMPEQSKLAETLWSIIETKNAYEDLINKTDELVKSQFIGHRSAENMRIFNMRRCA
ncbi:restriction endonuclease subunit S [Streptococcus anginosus]|uniref:restriction endonuclease subunit S n=1 Tax=Streptococcus anginosus TaxID=1328 RepID=UPI0021F825C9|nr:restriction endonuclease subunit S [Streptococcus anginosus]